MAAALAVLVMGGVLTAAVVFARERVALYAGRDPDLIDRQRIASSSAIVFGVLWLGLAAGDVMLSSNFGEVVALLATLASLGVWWSVRVPPPPRRPQWEADAERSGGGPVWGQPPPGGRDGDGLP